jgi:hypothetical protein
LIKLITIREIKIKDGKINIIGTPSSVLDIGHGLTIKYGIVLIKISNNGRNIYLEKNMMTYNQLNILYKDIQKKADHIDSPLFPMYYKNDTNFMIFPFLIIASISLVSYFFIIKLLLFIIAPLLLVLILVLYSISRETVCIDANQIIIKKDAYGFENIRVKRIEVLQWDFKLYIRLHLNQVHRDVLISTSGKKADYHSLMNIYRLFDFFNNQK